VTSEDESIVGLRNLATGKVRRIPVETIEDRINKGTANAGFINSLTRELPRDLIAWLASMNATVRAHGGDRDRCEFRILLTAGGWIARLLQGTVVVRCGVLHLGLSSIGLSSIGLSSIGLERTSPHGWCKLHQPCQMGGSSGQFWNFFAKPKVLANL
jgi:hypothetical protein